MVYTFGGSIDCFHFCKHFWLGYWPKSILYMYIAEHSWNYDLTFRETELPSESSDHVKLLTFWGIWRDCPNPTIAFISKHLRRNWPPEYSWNYDLTFGRMELPSESSDCVHVRSSRMYWYGGWWRSQFSWAFLEFGWRRREMSMTSDTIVNAITFSNENVMPIWTSG